MTLDELADEEGKSKIPKESNSDTLCFYLTERERKILQFFLKKALSDAEGLMVIGIGDKQTVNNIKFTLKKTGK